MSSATNEIQVQNIDHLGIVAGIVDEIGLVEQVRRVIGDSPAGSGNTGASAESDDSQWVGVSFSTIVSV